MNQLTKQEDHSTEFKLRDAVVPWPRTEAELTQYLTELFAEERTYGSVVYMMTNAALAAFRYASSIVGATGFQASCADLSFLQKSRNIKGPFMILKLEDGLYPQYDLRAKVNEFLESDDSRDWLRAQAQQRLDESKDDRGHISRAVVAHWEQLAVAEAVTIEDRAVLAQLAATPTQEG